MLACANLIIFHDISSARPVTSKHRYKKRHRSRCTFVIELIISGEKKKAALFLSDFMRDGDGRQNVLENVMQLQRLAEKLVGKHATVSGVCESGGFY